MFQDVKPVTLFASSRLITLRLWDEHAKKLVGFRRLKKLRKRGGEAAGEEPGAEKERRRSS